MGEDIEMMAEVKPLTGSKMVPVESPLQVQPVEFHKEKKDQKITNQILNQHEMVDEFFKQLELREKEIEESLP